MNTRILHCGENVSNYYTCIEKKIAGFTVLSAVPGDLVYLSVKVNGISVVGARGIIEQKTDQRPWPDSKGIKFAFTLKNVEFCKPFQIQPLAKIGGSYWAAKYLQASKSIRDEEAVKFLEDEFEKNRSEVLVRF